MDNIVYYYKTMMEAEHFPGWELFLLLNTLLWLSVIIRLNKIEKDKE